MTASIPTYMQYIIHGSAKFYLKKRKVENLHTKNRSHELQKLFIQFVPATFLITYSCMNNVQNKPNKLIIIF